MTERGFTVIETLVAFAILAMSMTALYASFGTNLRGLARAGNAEVAALLAELKLDELRTLRSVPVKAISGKFASAPYRWHVRPVADAAVDPNAPPSAVQPKRIRLSIWWIESGRRQSLDIETIVLGRTAFGQ